MGIFHSNIRITGGVMYSFQAGSPPPPPPPGGSLLFNGTSDAFYSASSSDFNLGTGDFTIEWFQKQLSSGSHPRVFSVGLFPATAAVSIEGDIFYFWANGSWRLNYSPKDSFVNRWVHIAIVRSGSALTVYEDGSLEATTTYTDSVGDSSDTLFMGNEGSGTTPVSGAGNSFYNGNITNFRWSKGVARYTSAFSTPTTPLTTIDGNTKALYLATSAGTYIDDATDNHTLVDVSGSSVTWSSDSPFA